MKKPKTENKEVRKKLFEVIKDLDFKKILTISFIVILGISFAYNVTNYVAKPKTVEVKVPVDKEVIKYVEKQGGTPTEKFIIYLNSRIDPVTTKAIAKAVDESSKKYSLPRKLVLSIINNESFFNPLAKSHKDCVGLMQINPPKHKEKVKNIPKTHLYHISINVNIGCKIFREYFDINKGDLHKTFHSYLGKKATKKEIEKYKNDILYTFAGLEMYEYIGQKEKEKEIEIKKEVELSDKNSKKGIDTNTNLNSRVLPESD